MKNLFKSKKFNSFLLTMIMIISLFFFGCSGGEDDPKDQIFKVVYRPYSTSRPVLLGKTYGEIIEENVLEVSSDILTRLVAEFGIGDVSVKDGEGTKIVSPDTSGVDYASLLGISNTLSDTQKKEYATDFGKINNTYYSASNKILILSNDTALSSTANTIVTYDTENSVHKAGANMQRITGTQMSVSSGNQLAANCAYKYTSGNTVTYIFIGDYIGSSANSIVGTTNIASYVSKIYNSNFNNIQKSFKDVTINDGGVGQINFTPWKWTVSGEKSSADDFLTAYLTQYQYSMAVEIANAILTRYETFTLNEELTNLYTTAQSSSGNAEKEAFIKKCCEYIDHLGILDTEIVKISSLIIDNVIGISNTKFAEKCASVLNETKTNYEAQAILEYKDFKTSNDISDVKVDGYIHSIIIFSNKEYTVGEFFLTFKAEDPLSLNFKLRVRNGNSSNIYPLADMTEDDFEGETYSVSVTDVPDVDSDDWKVSNSDTNKLDSNNLIAKSTLKEGTAKFFEYCVYSEPINPDIDPSGGWFMKDEGNSYVEFVFTTTNLMIRNEFEIVSLFA